jgi:hypothetical protein
MTSEHPLEEYPVKKRLIPLVVVAAVAATTALGASPALAGSADPGTTVGAPTTVTDGLFSPLSLEVDAGRVAYLSQNFTGELTKVARNGAKTTLYSAPGREITAVATRKDHVYFANIANDHTDGAFYSVPKSGGTPTLLADIYAYEAANNPDADNTYGFEGVSPECEALFPPPSLMVPPANYTGIVDIHPYGTLALANGLFVADAAMNAIVKIDYDGAISTVAVLPPQPAVRVPVDVLTSNGFPACAADYDFIAEPVPTDVEFGPDKWLYVTTLPGGFEDPRLGDRGSVYKVNPKTGEVRLVATGLASATGLAVSTSGYIYATELFGGGTGRISVLTPGSSTATPLTSVPFPSAIELKANRLFVSTDSLSETGEAKLSVFEFTAAKGAATVESSTE